MRDVKSDDRNSRDAKTVLTVVEVNLTAIEIYSVRSTDLLTRTLCRAGPDGVLVCVLFLRRLILVWGLAGDQKSVNRGAVLAHPEIESVEARLLDDQRPFGSRPQVSLPLCPDMGAPFFRN